MKKRYLLYVLMLMTTLSGCKKFLDEQPVSSISTDKFWKTGDDITAGMAGIYDGLQDMFSSNWIYWGDGRTDNLKIGGNGRRDYPYNELTSTTTGSDWALIYSTIARVNTAIKYIPTIQKVDPKIINDKLAQCYAIRAYCYFWLVRLWGDVPVWTEPYEDLHLSPYRAQTPAETIFTQNIIPDLEKSLQLADPTNTNVFLANTGGVYAILTDVYMWRKDYTNALNYSDKLMKLNRYSLIPTAQWKNLFIDPANTSNKESIWSLNWIWTQDGGVGIAEQIGAGDTNSDFSAEDSVFNYWTAHPTDIRGKQSIDFNVIGRDKLLKFYPVNLNPATGFQIYPTTNPGIAEVKFPLYRLADILLLRAEALNKTGDQPGAIALLNQVRKRANPSIADYTTASFTDVPSLENAILFERQLELYLEAKRWFDLVRTNKVISTMDPILKARQTLSGTPAIGFGDPRKILWPINRNNLNANTLLKQNPPYAD